MYQPRQVILVFLAILASLINTANAFAQDLADTVRKARPSIAIILAKADSESNEVSTGTGFFIGFNALVTAYHVVEGYRDIDVILPDGRTAKASLAAGDTVNDIAILKTSVPSRNWLALTVRASNLELGEEIVVLGYPRLVDLGPELSVTRGIVSSIRQNGRELQIDAALNPGNSGGPVVNKAGDVIGVARAMLKQSQALNFATPTPVVRRLAIDQGIVLVEGSDLNGRWAGHWKSSKIPGAGGQLTLNLKQNGNKLQGAASVTNSPFFQVAGLAGELNDATIKFGAMLGSETGAWFTGRIYGNWIYGVYEVPGADTGEWSAEWQGK